MKYLYLITGPAGVGKSTVSGSIVSKLSKCALIEGDNIYNLVVSGYVSPWLEGNDLDVFWKNSINLINNFLDSNISVVFNYIINPQDLGLIINSLNRKDLIIKFIVLIVDEETIIKRDNMREEDCRMKERSLVLLNSFKKLNFNKNNILDTSELSIDQTVKIMIENDRFVI